MRLDAQIATAFVAVLPEMPNRDAAMERAWWTVMRRPAGDLQNNDDLGLWVAAWEIVNKGIRQ